MALSQDTTYKLAEALRDDAIKYIQESEGYAEFMYEMFGEFLKVKMGQMDDELEVNIRVHLMDLIYLK
jgi:hypothetical protein